MKDPNNYPPKWNQARVKRLLQHHENQSEAEAAADDHAAWQDQSQTTMSIPNYLVPAVRDLLSKHTPP